MAVPPAPDDRSGVTQETSPGLDATLLRHVQRPTSHSLRLTLLVVLLALLLASTAAVAYLAATRPVPALGIEGSQESLQHERESVMAQAEQFMLRVNTYGPDLLEGDTMPEYRKLVEEVITPKFAADFEKNVPAAEQTVKEAGLARTCQVFSTGVSAIDSDSATALVAGSFTNSYPRAPAPTSGSRPTRRRSGSRSSWSRSRAPGWSTTSPRSPVTRRARRDRPPAPSDGATP